jgi:hypothetical protein
VANFWKQFWEMARAGSPGPETRDEVLRRHAVTAQVTWRDPTLGGGSVYCSAPKW